MNEHADDRDRDPGPEEPVAEAAEFERRTPRFFFSGSPTEARLAPEDQRHALRVLRVQPDDRLVGLDGRGGSWEFRVVSSTRSTLAIEVLPGSERRDPAPGDTGALPFLEIASAIPKANRLEDSWSRLVALGVARWRPLICARSGPGTRVLSERRHERLSRIAAETCKQCGRTWLPEVGSALTPAEWFADVTARDGAAVCASPRAATSLAEWTESELANGRNRALCVAIGPEGGFDADEERVLAAASTAALGPHVLRIEVAAEACAVIAMHAAFRGQSRPG